MSTSPPSSPAASLQPRVVTHPPYTRSLGLVAVRLGKRAGMPPDPWQADALELMCAIRDDSAERKWTCREYCEWVARQNGKGAILELRALAGFLVFNEAVIVWSAHEYKTAAKAFERCKKLIRRLGKRVNPKNGNLYEIHGIGKEPIWVKICNTNGEQGFERLNADGDMIAEFQFVARSKGSARGFTADLQIIDEAFAYTMEQHAALLMTLSAVPNAQIIYTSSPPLDGESGEIMYQLRGRGDPTVPQAAGEAPWEQDPSLGYRDWGAGSDLSRMEKDGINLDDRALWQATNPAMPTRITTETVAHERRSIGALEFGRERIGIWPPLSKVKGVVLDPTRWETLLDIASRRDGDVVLMPDITPMRDHTTIGLFGMRADGLEHVQLVDYREGASWLLERMVELHETLDPMAWVIDEQNGAFALLEDLRKRGIKVPDDPAKPHRGAILLLDAEGAAGSTAQFIDAFRALASPLRHIGQEPLNDAVKNVKARPIGDRGQIAWGRKISTIDIGPIVSVSGARYGYRLWKPIIGGLAPATARAAAQPAGSMFRPTSRLKL